MSLNKRAFTLLELLVSISLVMLLVSFVAISLRGVRASASRAESLSALRQMTLAYAAYSADHNQRLMPGYLDVDALSMLRITATLPDGTPVDQCAGQLCDASSYVWRLAPYVDNTWQTFFVGLDDPTLESRLNSEFSGGIYGPGTAVSDPTAVGISERPAFGMNSIFVGGDSVHGPAYATQRHPWNTFGNDSIAATRLSQVKNPSRLILFAPAAQAGGNDADGGYCELRPPFLDDTTGQWALQQWTIGTHGLVELSNTTGNMGTGLPIDRSGKAVLPLAHLDGSSAVEPLADVSQDMRRWNPFEAGRRKTRPAS